VTLARPARGYVAVQPLRQSTAGERVGSLFLPKKQFMHTLQGRALSVGAGVLGVAPGDVVIYERQSAHSQQRDPLPADLFGGDEGCFAVLIPCVQRVPVLDYLDDEILARKKALEALIAPWRGRPDRVPKDVDWQVHKHHHEITRLTTRKKAAGRSRAFTRNDQAGDVVKQGILAVITESSA